MPTSDPDHGIADVEARLRMSAVEYLATRNPLETIGGVPSSVLVWLLTKDLPTCLWCGATEWSSNTCEACKTVRSVNRVVAGSVGLAANGPVPEVECGCPACTFGRIGRIRAELDS